MAKKVVKKATKSAAARGKGSRARVKRTTGGSLKDFCRGMPHATEDVKWGKDLMFSVGGKIFAGFHADEELGENEFGFKCDDEDFDRLTAMEGIIPAPYAARFGWVAVRDRGAMSDADWKRLLEKSYGLVAAGLPKKLRRQLGME